ncbi:MAG TPA: DUF5658 family protein [Sandaracinaceae bacterium]
MAARERPRWIAVLLVLTCALNLLDVAATLFFVGGGHATEANPVMAWLLALGPAPFAIGKVTIVTSGAWVLWRFASHELAKAGSILVCSAYAVLAMLHLGWLHTLAR